MSEKKHYSDRKIRRTGGRSSSGWTQADERRWQVHQRRMREAERREQAERQRMLDGMSEGERAKFLADEQATKERLMLEQEQRRLARQKEIAAKKEAMALDGRLTAGYLHSELAQATRWVEQGGLLEGDYIEDPVAALTRQGGFAEIVREATGIKLQVNICLDCSNSMVHNGLDEVAVEATRALYLALAIVAPQLPANSLQVNLWLWAKGRDGKQVDWISDSGRYNTDITDDNPLGAAAMLPKYKSSWTGEDTWIHPLLERLEKWELQHGDHGAYRLDLIITDGVLEHPTDARKGDVIQDQRDGALQSVILNFLPYEKWGDYKVPHRCVQYPVEPDTLFNLMRTILGEWLVYIT